MENLSSSNSEQIKETKEDSNGCDQTSKTPMLGKRKKNQKEAMHVETNTRSKKIVKKRAISPILVKVLSEQASKAASSKRARSLRKTCGMIRAEEVISGMDPKFPTLLKTMVRTHVTTCFLMGLYKPFCIAHLPKKDVTVTVEDESGQEVQMKYLFHRTTLSAGWRNFAITQRLLEGDVVIFQVVQPLEPVKLKVYMVRANSEATEEGALGVVNSDAHKQQDGKDKGGNSRKYLSQWATKRKRFKSLQPVKKTTHALENLFPKTSRFANKYKKYEEENDVEIGGNKKKEKGLRESVSKTSRFADKSKNDEEENNVEIGDNKKKEKCLGESVSKTSRSANKSKNDEEENDVETGFKKKKEKCRGESVFKTSRSANKSKNDEEESDVDIIGGRSYPPSQVQFEDVKSFKDFPIVVDDLCIDSELPDDIRYKYYKLCAVRKAFLHARLMQGLNSKLISGMIYEIVSIADLIKTCDLTTCRSEFANWERALKSFHFMGMGVGFMIAHIRKLVGIAFESKDALKCRKYMEAKLERIRTEDEIANLKSRFVELKEAYKRCGGGVKSLKSKTESFKHKFQEEVDASW